MTIPPPLKNWFRRPENAVFSVFLVVFFWQGLFTLWDYGITWDAWEYYVGDKALRFYVTLDAGSFDFERRDLAWYDEPGHPDFHAVTNAFPDNDVKRQPYLVWPLGPLSSSVTKALFRRWLGVYEAHHLALVGWGTLLFAGMYRFIRRQWGAWAALSAVLLTALHPRFFAHLHNNVKDIPSAVLFTLTLLMFHEGMVSRRSRWLWLSAAGWGLALAAKPNAFFLPLILGPWFLYLLWRRRRDGEADILPTCQWPALAAYPFLGLGVMLLAWPYLLTAWPRTLLAYFASLADRGYAGPAGWNVSPLLHAVTTMPLTMLALVVGGLAVVVWRTAVARRLAPRDFLLLLWLIVPVLRVSVPGARDFDGIRHWLEFVPAAALCGGVFVQHLAERLPARWPRRWPAVWRPWTGLAILLLWLSPAVAWNIRNHPQQLVFFNSLIGGLTGAQERGIPEATDYWGHSYRQGYEWLAANAPPDSRLYVGVAEHLAWYAREAWLRPDIELLPLTGADPVLVEQQLDRYRGRIFLMYVTRPEAYHPLVHTVDGTVPPVWSITVDDGVILKIVRPDAWRPGG